MPIWSTLVLFSVYYAFRTEFVLFLELNSSFRIIFFSSSSIWIRSNQNMKLIVGNFLTNESNFSLGFFIVRLMEFNLNSIWSHYDLYLIQFQLKSIYLLLKNIVQSLLWLEIQFNLRYCSEFETFEQKFSTYKNGELNVLPITLFCPTNLMKLYMSLKSSPLPIGARRFLDKFDDFKNLNKKNRNIKIN